MSRNQQSLTSSRKARTLQRQHPIAYATLLLAACLPMIGGITALGIMLQRYLPSPSWWQIVLGFCLFIGMIPVLMLLGAFGWLVAARKSVPREVARAFFIDPGMGVFSWLSEKLYRWVYQDTSLS